MTDDTRKVGIQVTGDATPVKQAFSEVKDAGRDMAQSVAQSSQAAGKAIEGMGASAEKLNATQTRVVESIKRQAIGTTEGKSALLEYKAAMAGVSDAAAPYIAKIKQAETAQVNLGMSAKQTAFALRGVPAQMTDIVTSIASGQRPMMVLLQQGGQLKDMFGGAGAAARALGGYIVGLVNPVTVAAAAIGGVAYAAFQGSKELREFQNAAVLTGNAMGMSASQFTQMRDSLVGVAGTKGKAAEVLAEIAKSGKIAGENVRGIAEAAILMEKATGQPLKKTIDLFADLADKPAEAAAKANEGVNFLSGALYAQIKALEDQGRKADAAALAMRTLGDTTATRAASIVDNAGTIERAWTGVLGVLKKVIDATAEIGRPDDTATKLALVQGEIKAATGEDRNRRFRLPWQPGLDELRQQEAFLQEQLRMEQRMAEAGAARATQAKARIEWEKDGEKYLSRQAQMEREIARERERGLAAGIAEEEISRRIAAIRERFKEKGSKAEKAWFSQADMESAKQYESYFKKFAALEAEAEAKALGLNKAQGELAALLKDPVFQQMPETWRQAALHQAYAAVTAEQHRDAEAALQKQIESSTKAFEDYAKGMRESERKAEGDILKRVADLEWEARTYGLLESQVARLTLARLHDAREAAALAGENVESINRQIVAQERLIAALEGKELREANKKAADASAKEWDRVVDSFVDNIMRGGKSAAQYLKDLFRTLVLRPILQPIGQAVGGVVGSALGIPAAAAQGAGGSLVGSAAGSWLGSTVVGGSFLSGISGASAAMAGGTTFGVTGAIGGHAAAMGVGGTGLAGAAGSIGAGVSSALAAIPVWGWAAMAAMAIAALAKGGETRSGGKYTNTGFLEGPSGGEINGEATRTAIGATIGQTNELLKALGATATLAELQSGFEQSERGKGFAYAGGTLSTGATFGQTHGAGWQNRRGSMTAEQAAAAWGEELKQATLQALQAADVPGMLGDWLRSLGDIDALSGGALDAALGRLQKALGEKASLEDRYFELTHTQEEVLARNRQRERDALDESNRALYDQITALEDQVRLTGEAAAASVTLAEALQLLRNPLRTVEDIAQSIFNLEREGQGLQVELLRAQGDDPATRTLQRTLDTVGFTEAEIAAYDYNQALRDQIQALKDAKTAAELAADAERAAAQARADAIRADTDAAYRAVERAIAAQRQSAQAAVQAASDQRNAVQAVFDALKSGTERLYGQAAPAMLASQGSDFIAQALATVKATGYLPDAGDLSDAITAAMGGIETTVYESEVDRQRAQLVLAGQLSQLKTSTGDQLTVAERQLKAAEDQVESLDEMLESARSQLDALRGIDTSVLSVKEAVERLIQAMAREAAATGVKLPAQEKWVQTAGGQVWQSTGGAVAVANSSGAYIHTKSGQTLPVPDVQDWVNGQLAVGDALAVYQRAKEEGISANSLDKLMGWVDGTSNEWARNVGLPQFAVGANRIPQDMLAVVHQDEAVIPAAFNPWAGGALGNSQRLERLVEGLTEEVQQLRNQVAEGTRHQRRTADAVNGQSEAPMVVEVAA